MTFLLEVMSVIFCLNRKNIHKNTFSLKSAEKSNYSARAGNTIFLYKKECM